MSSNKGIKSQAKAREKIFRKAAAVLADRWGHTGENRELAIQTQIQNRYEEWKLIWDRAVRYIDRQWIDEHLVYQERLEKAQESLQKALNGLGSLEASVAGRDEMIKELEDRVAREQATKEKAAIQAKTITQQIGIIESQRRSIRQQAETIERLRSEQVSSKADLLAEIERLNKVIMDRNAEKRDLRQEIQALSTDNERLVTRVEQLQHELSEARDMLAAVTEPMRNCGAVLHHRGVAAPCEGNKPHVCIRHAGHFPSIAHKCKCGAWWG